MRFNEWIIFIGSVVGHLNITSTRLEYGGLYTCIARNFLGFVQHSAMLNIYGNNNNY